MLTAVPVGTTGAAARRSPRPVLAVIAALLARAPGTVARHSRPAPCGDHLSVHAPDLLPGAQPCVPRGRRRGVRRACGRHRWTCTREGAATSLWNDGLVIDTDTVTGRSADSAGGAVRRHRAAPGLAARRGWRLRAPPLRPATGTLLVALPCGERAPRGHKTVTVRGQRREHRWGQR